MERSIGRVLANVWTVDLQIGARTKVAIGIEDRYVQASPGGRYLLYLKNDHYWTMDLATGDRRTSPSRHQRVVRRSRVGCHRRRRSRRSASPAGRATTQTVLLYDKFDIWEIKPDGSGATRLTNGAAERGTPPRRAARSRRRVDRSAAAARRVAVRPAVEEVGLRRRRRGRRQHRSVTALVWLDKRVDRLAKAKKADRYAYVVQDFDDSPDYFVGDAVAGQRVAGDARPTRS